MFEFIADNSELITKILAFGVAPLTTAGVAVRKLRDGLKAWQVSRAYRKKEDDEKNALRASWYVTTYARLCLGEPQSHQGVVTRERMDVREFHCLSIQQACARTGERSVPYYLTGWERCAVGSLN